MSRLGVHCRIGSLEIELFNFLKAFFVHCRIGSLEISVAIFVINCEVHCRIGSLERTKRQRRTF